MPARLPAFQALPARAGFISPKVLDQYIDKLTKLQQRNDHRVAVAAADQMMRDFQTSQNRTGANADEGSLYSISTSSLPSLASFLSQ
jgi:hypothetical protein